MSDTYTVIINNKRIEKEIETFEDALEAWETGQLIGYEVPNYICSREDAETAYQCGLLDEEAFVFFDTMIYEN